MKIMEKHEKIVLMFSGGKDSLACLLLLKEWWHKIHVVFVNTGAAFPEILSMMEEWKQKLPNFHEIKSNQPAYVSYFGYPSDILPINYTNIGQLINSAHSVKINSYIDCCAANLWKPGADAVHQLGATLIIRGQKNTDSKRTPIRSGETCDGIEYLFPLQDWTDQDVMAYLKEKNFPLPPHYALKASSLDCWNCTAYCGEHKDKLEYMKTNHPDLHDELKVRLIEIKRAIHDEIQPLNDLVS